MIPANKNADSRMRLCYIGSRCFYVGSLTLLPDSLSGISRSVFFCPLRVFS